MPSVTWHRTETELPEAADTSPPARTAKAMMEGRMLPEQYGKVEKVRVKTRITTVDGIDQSGEIFLSPNQRIIDMMNDGRAFIAFEAEDGFAVLAKSVIAEIRQLRQFGHAKEGDGGNGGGS